MERNDDDSRPSATLAAVQRLLADVPPAYLRQVMARSATQRMAQQAGIQMGQWAWAAQQHARWHKLAGPQYRTPGLASITRAVEQVGKDRAAAGPMGAVYARLAESIGQQASSLYAAKALAGPGLPLSSLERISQQLYGVSLPGSAQAVIGQAVDELYDSLDGIEAVASEEARESAEGPLDTLFTGAPETSVPDGAPGDDLTDAEVDRVIEELEQQAAEFVAAEGGGLSWEAQRRLVGAFLMLAFLGTLTWVVVENEALSELAGQVTMISPVAIGATVYGLRLWEKNHPRPGGPDPDGDEDRTP